MTTRRCLVSGRVQGVWFRAWTKENAQGLGLTGWVKNLPDGRVEALIQGPRKAVDDMAARLRQGPPSSRVTGVDCEDVDDVNYDDFSIRR